jgi:hypothetical protein
MFSHVSIVEYQYLYNLMLRTEQKLPVPVYVSGSAKGMLRVRDTVLENK